MTSSENTYILCIGDKENESLPLAGKTLYVPFSLSSLLTRYSTHSSLDHGERLISSAIGIAPMPYHMVVVDSGSVGSGRSIHNGAECVWRTIKAMLAGESLSFTYKPSVSSS